MKKVILPILSLTLVLLSACETEEFNYRERLIPLNDYRQEFEGTYVGKAVCETYFGPDSTLSNSYPDTLIVAVEWDSLDSLWVNNWLIPVNESGEYHSYYGVPGYGEFKAEFSNDTLKMKVATMENETCWWTALKLK